MALNHIKTLAVSIDWESAVAPYAQIASQIYCMVESDQLSPGELLPQIRVLAAQLDANPSTVARAYDELASLGVLRKRQGSGCFVRRPAVRRPVESRLASLRSRIQELVTDAQKLGLTLDLLVAEMAGRYPPARERTGAKAHGSPGPILPVTPESPSAGVSPAGPSLWSPADAFVD